MKVSRACTIHLISLAVIVSFLVDITQAEDGLKATKARTQPSEEFGVIRFANDGLTVRVQDVSLRELLREIARQSGLALMVSGSAADWTIKDRITIALNKVSLDEGLRRILRHQNFALEYAEKTAKGDKSGIPRPARLWVFANGDGDYPAQTTVSERAKTPSSAPAVALDNGVMQAALESPDPEEREDAVEAVGESKRPDAIGLLSLALTDENNDVREAAIDALADIGDDAAAEALAIVLQDEHAALRETTVEALSEIGGDTAIRLLEQALQDNDEFVRDTATELLARMRNEVH